ncbi:ATP-binding protein [Humibacter ginsenosidimutans]|uniref:AAA family ATPase n=1 Tax=Humibacter ginsenosidimutans TaxID=2599293 RepID=A0A5B8M302_9MICO|nr:BTAD domain-containing putative transcriptional regulator [Humibacter ginsenosidimutans]QDZ14531.1 AAA family ATPase [Humibacter ginsenosidimutans]
MSQASTRIPVHRVAVLGPVLVATPNGTLAEPGGSTAKALVVSLLLARGSLSVRGIGDDLWEDEPPRNLKAALQTLVSRVRAVAADGLIVSAPGGYELGAHGDSDLAEATRRRETARAALDRGDAVAAEGEASAGLALWRGEPGADLVPGDLARRLAAAAADLRRSLALLRADARIAAGDGTGALSDLEPFTEAAPLDEDLELRRLRAHAVTGRRNDAIREFGEFRTRMRDELGTTPSADLLALHTRLLREPDPDAAPHALHVGIRVPPNPLVGRDGDIDALESLLATSRLTTILGAGGLGKTRLAQELAGRAAQRMPGVVVVELASVRSGDDVPLALASTLGIREYTGTRLTLSDPAVRVDVRGRILSTLAERPTLLVMDNCEHIIEAAAEWIADILASTRDVRVLATSRAPLMIAAEQVYQLQPLAAATADRVPGPAVTLFIDRARAARPSVVLPIETIERLCTKLDGLPLAIELAAARVRSMSVEEIERRIDNRFVLLRGGDRSAPERHRTLLAVIDWSWNLLGDSEQRTLRRLSVFVDGFDSDAALAAGDPRDDVEADLEGLVNQSLLVAAESELTGRLRYRMLETVREFGAERLDEQCERDEVAARIRGWADAFALDALETTYGPEQVATFRRVEEEQDNLVAALRNALETGDRDTASSVYAALAMHWTLRGAHGEVLGFVPLLLDALRGYRPDELHRDAAMVTLALIGGLSMVTEVPLGLRALARLRVLDSISSPRDPRLNSVVRLALSLPDLGAAMKTVDDLRADEDPAISSMGYLLSSQLAENRGEIDEALVFSAQSFAKAELAGDVWTVGMSAHSLAQLHSQRGDAADVLVWARRARTNLELLNAGEDLQQLEWMCAMTDVTLGRPESARATFERLSQPHAESESYDWRDLKAIGHAGLAEIAAAADDWSEAERQYALAEQVWGDPPVGFAPWYYGAGAGLLICSVRAGDVDDPRTTKVARRMRARLLRDFRVRAGAVDLPITGLAALGLGVWLLAPGREGADACQHAAGLELLALGHGVNARQDFPSQGWARAADDVRRQHPELDPDAAWRAVEPLTLVERTERVHEVVRSLRPLFVRDAR